MYDYDRRAAAGHPRSYAEAIEQAVKAYGLKPGLERKLAEAKRVARELDQDVKAQKWVSPDDDWASDTGKLERLWHGLRALFSHCFGFDPPALGQI